MRRFSPDFIEQVRLANDIVDIIGEDTFLKHSGTRYTGLCPFPSHNEKTPSFSVSPDLQLYHCFGCKQSGNIFTYLREKRGLDFTETIQFLAQRAGLSMPKTAGHEENRSYKERKKLLNINLSACEFYEKKLKTLPASHPVKQYLKQREISEETVKKFRLGYAPAGWDDLLSHLKKKNLDISLSMKLGLIKRKTNYYDFFRDRLMFPVFTKNGKEILGFGGRALQENPAKYINSQDSEIFHKGQIFYGWENTMGAIRKQGKALVVEGYTDFLSLYQRGVENVVATLGTALTEGHARWLSRYTEQVILCFDGDKAGEKATQRSLSVLLSYGLTPKTLNLEEGRDPDSFIREKGKKIFCEKVDSAQDLFLHLFLEELKNYPPGMDRFALIQKIADVLAQTKKGVLREYYITRFLDSFGFDAVLAKKALNQALKRKKISHFQKNVPFWNKSEDKNSFSKGSSEKGDIKNMEEKTLHEKKPQEEQTKPTISLESASKPELYLLILALENPNYYKEIRESGVIEHLNHTGVKHLFSRVAEYDMQELKCFSTLTEILSADLDKPQKLQKNCYPSLKYLTQEKVRFFIQDCINKVEKKKKHSRLKNITTNMRLDQENTKKYLKKVAEWAKKKTEEEAQKTAE